jgi:hypothetical protein
MRPDGVVVADKPVELAFATRARWPRQVVQPTISSGSGGSAPPCRRFADGRAGNERTSLQGRRVQLLGRPGPRRVVGGEDRTIIGEHPGRNAPPSIGGPEAGDHIRAGGMAAGIAAHTKPRVVIDNVQDRDLVAVGQLPMGDVGLPAFVGLLGAKRAPAGPGPLLRLRSDKATSGTRSAKSSTPRHHSPTTASREPACQVSGDGLCAHIQTLLGQLLAQRMIASSVSASTACGL